MKVVQLGLSDPVQEVAPALSLLRGLDDLDKGEAGTKFYEGTYPVGPIEDEVAILVRGDYYRIALLAFGFDAPPQSGQTIFIVGFMEDKTSQVDEEEVF